MNSIFSWFLSMQPQVLFIYAAILVVLAWGFLSRGALERHANIGHWCVSLLLFAMVLICAGGQIPLRETAKQYLAHLALVEQRRPAELASCVQRIRDNLVSESMEADHFHRWLTREYVHMRELLAANTADSGNGGAEVAGRHGNTPDQSGSSQNRYLRDGPQSQSMHEHPTSQTEPVENPRRPLPPHVHVESFNAFEPRCGAKPYNQHASIPANKFLVVRRPYP
jgi:hypothetical protein